MERMDERDCGVVRSPTRSGTIQPPGSAGGRLGQAGLAARVMLACISMRRLWLLPTRFMIGFQIAALVSAATACSGGGGASDATSSGAGGTAPGDASSSSGTLPPHPGGFALNAPATVTTGTAFLVSWTVSGATSCTGSATLNGSSTNLAGWTDSTSA